MTDDEIMKSESSWREVTLFIKYSKNHEIINRVLKENEKRFREMERRVAYVIETVTNSGMKYVEGEDAVDVCPTIGVLWERRLRSYKRKQKKVILSQILGIR